MRTSASKQGDRRIKVLTFLAKGRAPIGEQSSPASRPRDEVNGAGKRIPCVFKVDQQAWCEVRVDGEPKSS